MICCALCDGARAAGEVELVGLVHAVVGLDGDERHHEEDEEHAGHRQAVVHGPAALALGVTQLQTLSISSLFPGLFIVLVSIGSLGQCL